MTSQIDNPAQKDSRQLKILIVKRISRLQQMNFKPRSVWNIQRIPSEASRNCLTPLASHYRIIWSEFDMIFSSSKYSHLPLTWKISELNSDFKWCCWEKDHGEYEFRLVVIQQKRGGRLNILRVWRSREKIMSFILIIDGWLRQVLDSWRLISSLILSILCRFRYYALFNYSQRKLLPVLVWNEKFNQEPSIFVLFRLKP